MVNDLEKISEEQNEDVESNLPLLTEWKEGKIFTNILPWFFEVPQGYEGIEFKFGRPCASLDPGVFLLFGWGGLYKTIAIVDKRLRTTNYNTKPKQNLLTNDGVELTSVDYSVNWSVIDTESAMTKVTDYKKTLREITEARIRRVVGSSEFDELSRISPEDVIGPCNKKITDYRKNSSGEIPISWDNINEEYNLEKIGLNIEKLMLTRSDIPDELREPLSKNATAQAEANGMRTIADAQEYIAQKMETAAEHYRRAPESMLILYLEAMKEIAQGGKATFISVPGFDELMSKFKKG